MKFLPYKILKTLRKYKFSLSFLHNKLKNNKKCYIIVIYGYWNKSKRWKMSIRKTIKRGLEIRSNIKENSLLTNLKKMINILLDYYI